MTSTTIDISSSSYNALKMIVKEDKDISTLLDSIILDYIDLKIEKYLEDVDTISIDEAILDAKKKWQ
ncbi:MAG: hypothetical protein LAT82_02080 [Nanoarchaeota archaeon]|nr:hypothetical protein [Nanoarchaeota archaeon]